MKFITIGNTALSEILFNALYTWVYFTYIEFSFTKVKMRNITLYKNEMLTFKTNVMKHLDNTFQSL